MTNISTPTRGTTRIDLATAAHLALGIEAYFIVEVESGYTWTTAYVKSPRHVRQYAGCTVGATCLPQLRERALAAADDIAAELAPPPAAPAAKATKPTKKKARACAAQLPLTLITTLSNPTRDGFGIRAWVESVTTRQGRRTVTEHRGFVQAPYSSAPIPTDIFAFRAQAEAAVNTECSRLIAELAQAAA